MYISVIIPTYKRVKSLSSCIDGINNQSRLPDEVIVVIRDTDIESLSYVAELENTIVRCVLINTSGTVAALNLGIMNAIGDVIVVTDDDTVPFSNWIEKIEAHFNQDFKLGGLAGKDYVYHSGVLEAGNNKRVGKLLWFGRMIGNHHIGAGGIREVDIMKGANMSFRKEAIEGLWFDSYLKGSGAQVHLEVGFSLSIKEKGWKLIYDPTVCVNHFPAERHDEDKRNGFNETAAFNNAHNETYSILRHLGLVRRILFLFWIFVVGSKPSPGIVQYVRMVPSIGNKLGFKKLLISFKGRIEGWKTWRLYNKSGHYE
ncbi:MAG: glycosyltransferase family 2 protein [Candidatus Pristimantibacillus sp.]